MNYEDENNFIQIRALISISAFVTGHVSRQNGKAYRANK